MAENTKLKQKNSILETIIKTLELDNRNLEKNENKLIQQIEELTATNCLLQEALKATQTNISIKEEPLIWNNMSSWRKLLFNNIYQKLISNALL